MLQLIVVFIHLLATCVAIGAILAVDLRLLGKLLRRRKGIAAPNAFVTRLVGMSLTVLCVSGAALVWLGLEQNPDYLLNPKLQAKLLLVAVLVLNAGVLHLYTFPHIRRERRVNLLSMSDVLGVALPIALSNSLWLFCAFLGTARAWNFAMPLGQVLAMAAAVFAVTFVVVAMVLSFASGTTPSVWPLTRIHLVPKMRSPASPNPGTM